ncbi:MAG: PadR family transcriptional regulator [candidate division Zixibacteria bacterium]
MTDQELTILAILSETERYGYEIDKLIAARKIKPSWKIALSSIYAVLSRLLNRGLITSREVVQSGRPSRKLFAISYSGRVELEAALSGALMPNDRLLGQFELILLVWPILSQDKRNELLLSYYNWLSEKQVVLAENARREINPLSAAYFERPLATIRAEIAWLKEFSSKNGIQLS